MTHENINKDSDIQELTDDSSHNPFFKLGMVDGCFQNPKLNKGVLQNGDPQIKLGVFEVSYEKGYADGVKKYKLRQMKELIMGEIQPNILPK